jgi:arylsulfatase A-like enzyme
MRIPTTALIGSLALTAACGRSAPEQSLVLFAVDTLRADRVGALGGGQLTPRIDQFAAGARVFEAAYSQATQTHPAMASVMTGLAPPHHGAVSQAQRHGEDVVTLAELLGDAGLRTGSFVANLCQLQDYGRTVWSDGWDVQFCGEDLAQEQYLWDEAVVDNALEWIGEEDSSFFCWLHLMDPHSEYRPPPDLWDYEARPVRLAYQQSVFYADFLERYELPPEDVRAELEELYDAQVPGVDRQFGRLVDALAEAGRLDDTWIVLVADHGEELFETWPKAGHGFSLTEGVLHVPLMISGPGIEPGRVAEPVETMQVTPTALELFGIGAPYALDCRSLLGDPAGRGWAASFIGDRASVRRDRRRWWGYCGQLDEIRSIEEYLAKYPSHLKAPWYTENELLAEYEPGSNQPLWLDIGEPAFERAVRVAFRQPISEFLREGGANEEDAILDPALDRALERLGYK